MKPVVSAFNAWSWYVPSPQPRFDNKIRKQLDDSFKRLRHRNAGTQSCENSTLLTIWTL